jgi:hypothetical protein
LLNRRLATFEADRVTIVEALTLIHRQFDPDNRGLNRARSALNASRRLKTARAAEIGRELDRRFSVQVQNLSVGDVLTEVSKAHGAVWWARRI